MVTSINFGKIATIGGKTVLSGSNSGIDSESLITSLTAAKRAPAVALEAKQKTLANQSTAYATLKTLLAKYQSSADLLRNPPGVGNGDSNLFQYRTTTLTAQGSTQPGSAYMSATIAAGTAPQTHSISDVTTLAAATKQQSGVFTLNSADDAVVFASEPGDPAPASGSSISASQITIKGKTLTFAVGDSLNKVRDTFNAASSVTGITANVLQTSSGQYRLVLAGSKTGSANAFDMNDSGTVTEVGTPDVPTFQNTGFSNVQVAANATFKLDGISVQRDSNTFTDVVPGATINLLQTTASGVSVNLVVAPDVTSIKTGITNLLDNYNSLRTFYAAQTARNDDGSPKSTTAADGTVTVTAVLANDPTLRSIMSSLSNEVTNVVSGVPSGALNKLSDIGVTFSDYAGDDTTPATKNILVLDDTKLTNALNTNFDQLANIFQFQSTSTAPDFQVFKRTNDLSVSDFTVNLDPVAKTYTATYTLAGSTTPTTVNLTATALTSGGGVQLVGPDGSAIKGLQMIFAGATASTGSIHISQGIGDRMFNALDNATNTTNGTLTNAVAAITTKTSGYTDEISKIDDQVATYRDQLVDKFSKLESALASINTILQQLDAQQQARNNQ